MCNRIKLARSCHSHHVFNLSFLEVVTMSGNLKKKAKSLWEQIRLLLAEYLLYSSVRVAPTGTEEHQEIKTFIKQYCDNRLGALERDE